MLHGSASQQLRAAMFESRATTLALLGFCLSHLALASTLPARGPSIRLPGGRVLETRLHPDARPEIVAAFMANVPFQSFIFHTVSSGRNLVFLMPTSGDQFRMKSLPGEGLKARSSSDAGTLFFRHDQMCVLTYGYSRDHESFLPPVLYVEAKDLPLLQTFGGEVWEGQLRGERKTPFIFTFTSDVAAGVSVPVPSFKDEMTGNQKVDEAVAFIRSQTWRHWLEPPQELVHLLSTGDSRGQEGTEGYIFPPMVIGNGVMMVLSTYAHSGVLNVLASLLENKSIGKDDIILLQQLVKRVADTNLPYLRSLSLDTICGGFDRFFGAWDQAETAAEVRRLVGAISLFGALMHGWFVFLFPYRLGTELRRQAPRFDSWFSTEPSEDTFRVPLRFREGRGLGVATWSVGTPSERENFKASSRLPASLPALTPNSLPLIVGVQPSAVSISLNDLAVLSRGLVEEHLSAKGAILFRNLPVSTFSEAGSFISSLGYTMYHDPSGRERVAEGLYHSSLAVPADINIAPHQEHIVSNKPPSKLFLFCQSPSVDGGETPLAHAGDVWDWLQSTTQAQLRRRGVRFEMVRGNAGDPGNPVQFTRSWQEHFSTDDLQTAINKAKKDFNGTFEVDDHGNIILRSGFLLPVKVVQGREIFSSQLQNVYSLRWLWGDADEYVPDDILEDVMSAVWNAATVFRWKAVGGGTQTESN